MHKVMFNLMTYIRKLIQNPFYNVNNKIMLVLQILIILIIIPLSSVGNSNGFSISSQLPND